MADSDKPRYGDLEVLEKKIDGLTDKFDKFIGDPDGGVFARVQKLESSMRESNIRTKTVFAMLGAAAAAGGAALPKMFEVLSQLL